MFKSVLLVAAVLVALYATLVSAVPDSLVRRGYGRRDNMVRVENVLYRTPLPGVILVGSSMAGLLASEMLPADWGNLAVGAGSSLTGLEIIERSALTPLSVIVEVNMLMRPSDGQLLDDIYAQPMHWLRDRFSWLRLQNHPATLLFSLIQSTKGSGLNIRSPDKYELGMAVHTQAFTNPLPQADIERRVDAVFDLVERLASRGIHFHFVRFPEDPGIAGLPQLNQLATAVRKRFPVERWRWLSVPPDGTFTTTDGLHLETASARRMAGILIGALEFVP